MVRGWSKGVSPSLRAWKNGPSWPRLRTAGPIITRLNYRIVGQACAAVAPVRAGAPRLPDGTAGGDKGQEPRRRVARLVYTRRRVRDAADRDFPVALGGGAAATRPAGMVARRKGRDDRRCGLRRHRRRARRPAR